MNKKIISFVSSLAITLTAFASVVSVKAEEITLGMQLELVENDNNSATIAVYAKGFESSDCYGIQLEPDADSGVVFSGWSNDASKIESAFTIKTNAEVSPLPEFAWFNATVDTSGYSALSSKPVAYITVTFAEPIKKDFNISLCGDSYFSGMTTDGSEEYLELAYGDIPVSTVTVKHISSEVEVKTEGALYNKFADAAVYACVADAVTVADVTGKTLTWNIKAADKVVGTTPVNVGTVLSGEESTVVFGLMIVNDNDTAGFNTIDSAVLVIE